MSKNRYKRCSYCDIQLKDSRYPYFYEHMSDSKFICNDEECMRKYLREISSKMNLIVRL